MDTSKKSENFIRKGSMRGWGWEDFPIKYLNENISINIINYKYIFKKSISM